MYTDIALHHSSTGNTHTNCAHIGVGRLCTVSGTASNKTSANVTPDQIGLKEAFHVFLCPLLAHVPPNLSAKQLWAW